MTNFTSKGTKGLQLDRNRYTIPEGNNLYGIVSRTISKQEIAEKFHLIGWSVRKSAFTDFEIESEWAMLNIEGENEILIKGVIDEDHLSALEQLFIDFGTKYSLELYDEQDELIRTLSNITSS